MPFDVSKKQDAQAMLAAIVESSDNAIIGKDLDGTILSWNRGAQRMYGYSPEEAIGRNISILTPSANVDEILGILTDIGRDGNVHNYETERITKDGKLLAVSLTVSPIRDESGSIVGASTIARDITANKRTEETLRASEQRLQAIFDKAGVGIVEVNDQDQFVGANEYALEILGYSREELFSMNVNQLTFPEDRPRSDDLNARLHMGEFDRVKYEKRYLRRDGSPVWVNVTVSAVRDSSGRHLGAITTVEDISEQKQAEEALRLSEEKFATAFANNPAAIALTNLDDGLFLDVNDTWQELMGWSREEAIGCSSTDLDIWPTPEARARFVNELTEHGSIHGWELELRKRSGERIMIQLSAQILTIADERVVLSTLVDVTKRKRAEETLKESERRYRELAIDLEVERGKLAAAIENMPVGVVIGSAQGNLLSMNTVGLTLHGFTSEEEMFAKLEQYAKEYELLYPNRQVIPFNEWPAAKAVRGEFITDYEVFLRNIKQGSERVVSYSTAPVHGADGKTALIVYVMQDLTERKHNEEELKRAYARLERMFSSNVVGMLVADPYGGLYEANDYTLNLMGYTREEFDAGLVRWDKATPPEYAPADHHAIEELRARGGCTPYEKEYIRKDGSRVWVLLADAMLPGPEEQIIAFVLDISDRKHAEEEVKRLNAELEQRIKERTAELENTNKELEAFSYSVSHDLRAPLRAIDGFSSTLLKRYHDALDPQGQDYLDRVRKAAQRMTQLIDDILGLSRAGRAEIHKQPVDMSAMASDILKELTVSQPERQAEIAVEDGLVVDADSHLLRIVFDNLLGNAWKFTGKREITRIEVGSLEKDGERVYYIRDNGAGFNPEYADKLFAPFQRLHSESEFTGTGIGLALVQRIIRRHSGRIWAESEVDKGATFFFTLGEADR